MKLIPLGDRVLLSPLVVESKSTSGIILSGEISKTYLHGEVIAVGPGKQKANGSYVPVPVKIGDKVVYGNVQSTLEDMQDGVKVFLVEQNAIIALIEE